MWEIVLTVVGGLILFLYAVTSISGVIQKTLGAKAERWIARFTSTTLTGILTGTIITILLDSSSAVIIITIILVNAKLLSFRQAMGIVLGANIGTTFSSQIIALDIGRYSPVFLIIGFIFIMVSSSERIGNIGRVILYFGILFFGLFTMEQALEPLKDNQGIHEWFSKMEKPMFGALTGAVVTLVLQSSSATVGMAIILAKKGLITLSAGIAIMLGAELGTCSDTLLATIKGSRQAIKTGFFHLFFNIISIVLGLVSFYPFIHAVEWISGHGAIDQAVANAHMLFNIGGVLFFAWFLKYFELVLNYMFPERTSIAISTRAVKAP